MKQLLILISINVIILFNAKSQDTIKSNSITKKWESEIERIVFRNVMSFDKDSIQFIEAFLVFQISSGNKVEKSFLIVGSNQIDTLENINRLHSNDFLVSYSNKQVVNKNGILFFIQPLLFGKSKDIGNLVTDPSFYRMSFIPTFPIFNDRESSKVVFLFNQINYVYRVGR